MTIDDKFPELLRPINEYTYEEVVKLTLEQISNAIKDLEHLKKSVVLFKDWIQPEDLPKFKRSAVSENFYDQFGSSNISLLQKYSSHLKYAYDQMKKINNLQKNHNISP